MEQNLRPKWEGKVSTKLSKVTADQIWPLFTDGEPGCIRYCAGFSIPSSGSTSTDEHPVSWSKERLIAVDHVERCSSYEMIDSNIGFKSYVSTVKIVPGDDNNEIGQSGCAIEWSFTVDPVEGLVLDDLVNKYDVGLQRMAKRMEDAVLSTSKFK